MWIARVHIDPAGEGDDTGGESANVALTGSDGNLGQDDNNLNTDKAGLLGDPMPHGIADSLDLDCT
jgi:hypothetical protein